MDHPGFWAPAGPHTLFDLVAHADATIPEAFLSLGGRKMVAIRTLDEAGPDDVSFFDNRKYLAALKVTRAGAVFVSQASATQLPETSVPLVARDPYRAFARALELFFPDAGTPKVAPGTSPVDETAQIEDGVIIEPGAVIGAGASIGRGTRIAAGAVIGYRVAIGRDGFIGPGASITHALIGNRVIIHAGARVGQDGFGFAMGPGGHYKVRQVGRVIIQDDVEIGANSTIDRGALKDTIIGEGTKIDNLVQIAHNVVIGRHCVIAALTGISGSTVLEDYVAMGGQCGTVGHIRIGAGAQIGAQSGVSSSIPRGERWGGTPAKPMAAWAREVALLKRLAKRKAADNPGDTND
ncbi:UDP-3-O-(3-hydroxymyristoyl) glucosamine N-acyltransferase [Rhodomicrobium vannielii ATCC 17100]|uniref:UDP-3-O-acylglucosamine N-acyltransferase n=1 Tax=Rhodomicrobium vannielii (strain ATCC 17100 / DSM 162 / LMG 4299 / NCIMB 10020 / ATH 3.1.1) TaxID=648757 RepID=E3I1E8_RHOVT|nr:UDP-3-O-(3-hydroxymyristoyl)glucosamine N-acyltransferase [Rhodomicrobium vannielii]ADP71239.1 UDP-3-O-(3-hydroxymyristoyl) glucosamine N-acyltransferase [Rhodomicrobium vannielii ATCC 17100]